MDPELKKLLEDNLTVSYENKEMLKKLVAFQRFSQITRVVYWVVIIGIAIGAFYFIQPFFDSLFNIYGGGLSDINTIKGFIN